MASPSASSNTGSEMMQSRTNSGLSTQILIKINKQTVGAIQSFSVTQNRQLKAIQEIGTDGQIEVVPSSATTFDLSIDRMVFDGLSLPEAFARSFKLINAQRVPFDIEVFDLKGIAPTASFDVSADAQADGTEVLVYHNCWFKSLTTPYSAGDYTIVEKATITAETAYITKPGAPSVTRPGTSIQTDDKGIEAMVNRGNRRGAMDAGGILKSILNTQNS